MAHPRSDFPPVRACLFDMDGLLLDTEDKGTQCINILLARYGKTSIPWSVKAQMQGRPSAESGEIFHKWAQLPISREQYLAQQVELQRQIYPTTKPLPGVEKLLGDMGQAKTVKGDRVHIALVTSSHERSFKLKTAHLQGVFGVFEKQRIVLGDDRRISKDRGKPAPDMYLLALETINKSLSEDERYITKEECLVFEDSVLGVEAGRRAGMRVIWVPHPGLKLEYEGREKEVLAARTRHIDSELCEFGNLDDGWAEYSDSLVGFPYRKFGIVLK